MTSKCTKWPESTPFGREIDKMDLEDRLLQDLPKFTQIWILGLKICHLATLEVIRNIAERNWYHYRYFAILSAGYALSHSIVR
jgi:hypothetical protein